MEYTKQFIQDSIEGGWKPVGILAKEMKLVNVFESHVRIDTPRERRFSLAEILLDPKAWAAVGKVRGWGGMKTMTMTMYKYKWYKFIDGLDDGKSIEEALEAISK